MSFPLLDTLWSADLAVIMDYGNPTYHLGHSDTEDIQQLLYYQAGLDPGKEHTIVCSAQSRSGGWKLKLRTGAYESAIENRPSWQCYLELVVRYRLCGD